MSTRLTTTRHDRDSAGLTYVYPVLSRRSGGLSIGVNLNPNNACNWRCLYCQVPALTRGAGPAIDLAVLEAELRQVILDALHGDFFDRYALPADQRIIRDVALSGNGESTTSPAFAAAVGVIGRVCTEFGLLGQIKLVLISNGSQMRKPGVQQGLANWGELGGEVWFKLDSATEEGIQRINQVNMSPVTVCENLAAAGRHCPVWIQTCLFAFDGLPPAETEQAAYLAFLESLLRQDIRVEGILLYGMARPSLQREAPRLSALPLEWLEAFAHGIERLGLVARVHV